MAAKKIATKQPVAKKSSKAAKAKATDKTPATKSTKPAKAKKAVGDKGPGVIGSIVEFLSAATAAKPLSKAALLEKLVARFPDRGGDAMHRTINCQVPSRLRDEKELDVQKNEHGYWIAK